MTTQQSKTLEAYNKASDLLIMLFHGELALKVMEKKREWMEKNLIGYGQISIKETIRSPDQGL